MSRTAKSCVEAPFASQVRRDLFVCVTCILQCEYATSNEYAQPQRRCCSFVPEKHTLPLLRQSVQKCRGCDLYKNATQAVFGEIVTPLSRGQSKAAIMMIGEQPGDREDTEGRPFVGPSGKLLDRCLQEANIDRRSVYVTNAVKHFKWEPRGKRRIHKKPGLREIRACRPWLDAELDAVRPDLIVCLGAVAAQSLLGASFKITKSRGMLQKNRRPAADRRHRASFLDFACHHR